MRCDKGIYESGKQIMKNIRNILALDFQLQLAGAVILLRAREVGSYCKPVQHTSDAARSMYSTAGISLANPA
jgi:hypothetical protein